MFLKWLVLIEFCLKLLIIVDYKINLTTVDENNHLCYQNTIIANSINGHGKMDENVMTITAFNLLLNWKLKKL